MFHHDFNKFCFVMGGEHFIFSTVVTPRGLGDNIFRPPGSKQIRRGHGGPKGKERLLFIGFMLF